MPTMADLYFGCGGFRAGFESEGFEVVYGCEIDRFAVQTYNHNFGTDHEPTDIKGEDPHDVPDFDFLTAGFPCPSFSISGVSKRNSLGRKHGFEGKQGDLFWDVCRFIEAKQPVAALLENVENLVHHDGGRTMEVIVEALEALDYDVSWRVIDGALVVPQHRERTFILASRIDGLRMDDRMIPEDRRPKVRDIIEDNPDPALTLGDGTWACLQRHRAKHEASGNGFGYSFVDMDGVTRTISARYHKDGGEALVKQSGRNPRKLTIIEMKRLFGFPEGFEFPVSRTQAYKQMGNSVVVPLVNHFAKVIGGRI